MTQLLLFDNSKRAQKVSALPEETIKAYVARQNELDEEISKAGLLRAAGVDGTICTKHGNDVVDWYTPKQYIEAVREVLGTIDLDPASSAHAQKVVQAGTYYTARDDGLAKEWSGTVYLKPEHFRKVIEEMYPKAKRIELFARTQAEGWDGWGNECPEAV